MLLFTRTTVAPLQRPMRLRQRIIPVRFASTCFADEEDDESKRLAFYKRIEQKNAVTRLNALLNVKRVTVEDVVRVMETKWGKLRKMTLTNNVLYVDKDPATSSDCAELAETLNNSGQGWFVLDQISNIPAADTEAFVYPLFGMGQDARAAEWDV